MSSSKHLAVGSAPANLLDPTVIPPRPYLRDEVYRVLRNRVSEVAASTDVAIALSEADLARELGVSRTPVREALSRLHQEGLVRVSPRRKVQIVPATLSEYLCWLEIRETIEGMAARRAAATATPALVAEMRDLFRSFDTHTQESSDAIAAFGVANVRFHSLLLAESRDDVLIRLGETYSHLGNARRRITARLGRLSDSMCEHEKILTALEAHDPDAAEAAARSHVRNLRLAVSAHLNSLEP
jgi:DNA-binding GntR family transcriptional regulator